MFVCLAGCKPAPPPKQPPASQGKIQIGDFLATPQNCGMIHGVRPVYPEEARKARLKGVVKVDYVITKTGELRDIHVISGDPVFVPAALAAVAQMRFAPCLLNSEPVEVKSQADIDFNLNQ